VTGVVESTPSAPWLLSTHQQDSAEAIVRPGLESCTTGLVLRPTMVKYWRCRSAFKRHKTVNPRSVLRWWERPADDGVLFRILRLVLRKDELTLIAGLFVMIVSTPWVLFAVVSLAAAGVLCAFLIRFANRKQSSSLISIGDL